VGDHATTPANPQPDNRSLGFQSKRFMMSSAAMSKKNKGKKVADPNETSKLLAAKISQLEQDAAGEKDQEAEIGASPYSHFIMPCIQLPS
jgi:hypothetical protein